MVIIRRETWEQYYPDCVPLWTAHHNELNSTDPLDPDLSVIKRGMDSGNIVVLVARDNETMAGYCWWTFGKSVEIKDLLCADQRLWYVDKPYRRGTVAYRLFKSSIDFLKSIGVRKIYPHHWFVGDSPKAARIFESFGAKPEELVYSLWID